MTFTKEQLIEKLQHRISVASGFPESEKAQMDLELARIALASLEAEPVAYIDPFTFKNFSTFRAGETDNKRMGREWAWANPDTGLIPVYTAPPAPVVPDEATAEDCQAFVKYDVSDVDEAWANGFNACRAAILQGAEPASQPYTLPLDYLQGHKDGLEWAARLAEANHPQTGDWLYDDPLDLAQAIRNGPDMPEAAGNSPAIPDGYALVPVDMAPEMMRAVQLNSELGAYAAANLSGAYSLFREFWDVAVAAVPHQEVKDPAGETISEPYEFNSMSQKFHYDRTFSFASAQQWVSCNERMPDAARNIAMYGWRIGSDGEPYYGPAVDEGYLALNGKFYAYDWDQPGSIGDIHAGIEFSATHWMYWELPEAPQQEGE